MFVCWGLFLKQQPISLRLLCLIVISFILLLLQGLIYSPGFGGIHLIDYVFMLILLKSNLLILCLYLLLELLGS